jgi:hypothetical protein
MAMDTIRRVLLHGRSDEWFNGAVKFAYRLTEGFGAELHVVYTITEPLSAGWTAEMTPERLPELHRAMEEEARTRLAAVVPPEEQENIVVAIRTGPAADELVDYTAEHAVDLAIIQAADDDGRELIERGRCSVLLLR